MRRFLSLGATLLCTFAGSGHAQIAAGNFDNGLHGWTAFKVEGLTPQPPASALALAWSPTQGHPGAAAFVEVPASDSPHSIYFSAPSAYLGDKSFLLGRGHIRYDIRLEIGSSWASPDIYIEGAGMLLRTPAGFMRPTGEWVTVSAPLEPTGAWWSCVSGAGCEVTPEVFERVLSDLTGLYLLAEYREGPLAANRIGLDNVAVIPEPATVLLLGAGLAVLFTARRPRA